MYPSPLVEKSMTTVVLLQIEGNVRDLYTVLSCDACVKAQTTSVLSSIEMNTPYCLEEPTTAKRLVRCVGGR